VISITPVVELDQISLRHGAMDALCDVSLRIDAGERVALVGSSGAGKTSLLSIINTSVVSSAGTIHLFGQQPLDLTPHDRRALRRRIATVHQGLHLPGSLRVIHNVNAGRLGEWSTPRALWSLVRPRGTESARAALDQLGIADMLWRRTDTLSGGERQRVALARMMVQSADLVLADEPIASLDPARARDVVAALVAAAQPSDGSLRAVVVSLHAIDLATEFFDRVIGLRSGRVVFDLPATDVTDEIADDLYDLDRQR
jgi:phosphonate transport system ATP-binding protein